MEKKRNDDIQTMFDTFVEQYDNGTKLYAYLKNNLFIITDSHETYLNLIAKERRSLIESIVTKQDKGFLRLIDVANEGLGSIMNDEGVIESFNNAIAFSSETQQTLNYHGSPLSDVMGGHNTMILATNPDLLMGYSQVVVDSHINKLGIDIMSRNDVGEHASLDTVTVVNNQIIDIDDQYDGSYDTVESLRMAPGLIESAIEYGKTASFLTNIKKAIDSEYVEYSDPVVAN